ncbi:LPXTG cell wall anchor domain-containing protein [Streptococcus marmotae]|uniref:LPXTG cell wall anchor domain-containing protein n=1 Tax=Streptococcus marmotae TaxID=1825069 RepID=UPI0008350EE5|nr:LPXTG cell wall anchor domain-containing protein [Streptococcus marmotae]
MNKKKLFLAGLASVTLLGAAQAAYTISVSAQGTEMDAQEAAKKAATILVKDKNGQPAPGVTVELASITATGTSKVGSMVTNDQGVAIFNNLTAGLKYKATVMGNDAYTAGDGSSNEFTHDGKLATGSTASLTVEKVVKDTENTENTGSTEDSGNGVVSVPTSSAVFRVQDKEGKPVEGATVAATDPNGDKKEGKTGKDGNVILDKLAVDVEYAVKVTAVPEGYKLPDSEQKLTVGKAATNNSLALSVEKVSKKHEVLNENLRNDKPELAGSSHVVVKVVDNSHTPVPGATVKLFAPGGTEAYKTATADEFGNANFAGVLPGDYTAVVASVPEGYEESKFELPVKAVEHETTNDFITVAKKEAPKNYSVLPDNNEVLKPELSNLEGSSQVVVKVVDNSHTPVPGATVKLFVPGAEGTYKTVTADEFGNAVFTGVLPGDYSAALTSVPEGYELTNFELSVKAVEHETTEDFITVNKKVEQQNKNEEEPNTSVAQVRVKVVDEAGKPVPNVSVDVLVNGKAATYTTNDQGVLELTTNGGAMVRYRIATLPAGYEYVMYNGSPVSNQGMLTANAASLQERTLVLKNVGGKHHSTGPDEVPTVDLPKLDLDNLQQNDVLPEGEAKVIVAVVDYADQSKPLAGVGIKVTVGGKEYRLTTGADGTITIPAKDGETVAYEIVDPGNNGYGFVEYGGMPVSHKGEVKALKVRDEKRTLVLTKGGAAPSGPQGPIQGPGMRHKPGSTTTSTNTPPAPVGGPKATTTSTNTAPAPGNTTKPGMSTSTAKAAASSDKAAAKKEEDKKVLPKTGDASSLLTVVGTVLSGLGLAGVAKRRKK